MDFLSRFNGANLRQFFRLKKFFRLEFLEIFNYYLYRKKRLIFTKNYHTFVVNNY